jgi:hypothetical protein
LDFRQNKIIIPARHLKLGNRADRQTKAEFTKTEFVIKKLGFGKLVIIFVHGSSACGRPGWHTPTLYYIINKILHDPHEKHMYPQTRFFTKNTELP